MPIIDVVYKAAAKTGSLTALAKRLGITRNAFYAWHRVPAERVLQIEKITGISRHEMRPDLYPQEEGFTHRRRE
jgi:DNA-binding transcriptional regulator YdaS (Cro superfamily)